jgi:hypothetical protein
MKISVIKIDGALMPVGIHAQEDMQRLKNMDEFVIDVKMHRNPAFHRKSFALLKMIYDSQEGFTNFDLFREWVTMKAGYVITGQAPNGTTLFMAESLSFESMSQDKFEKWYSSVIDVAIAEYGLDENLLNNILGFA